MPSYNVGSADKAVAAVAYKTAKSEGASSKVLLALFEAGFVESNFKNLKTAVDHDSLGYLQQRPSQGWPDPTNVVTATKSFVNKAKKLENKYPSAAKLAQAVQVSAYPERYAQAAPAATALLKIISAGDFILDTIDTVTDNIPGVGSAKNLVEGVQNVGEALKDIAGTATKGGRFAEQILKLALPTNLTRLVVGAMGVVFVFIGIYTLTREVRK